MPARKLNINFGLVSDQTLGDCMKELLDTSYEIYNYLLAKDYPISLVCGGQSPSYYCLAMINFKIYNPEKVEIVILPHSKGGIKSRNQFIENKEYCERLTEKNIQLREHVAILDSVHSGTGILSLESALVQCYNSKRIKVEKISINYRKDISLIPVDKQFIVRCAQKFSDVFQRLIPSFRPEDFKYSEKFINQFILEDNPIAEMTIDLAKQYPAFSKDSDWFNSKN